MNGRTIGAIVAILAVAGLGGFFFLTRSNTGAITDADRVKHTVEDVAKAKPGPVQTPPKPATPAPVVKPSTDGAAPLMELADQPDVEFDPMSQYPLNKQGMTGAFSEMQIEFDACREEKGVTLDDDIQVVMTVKRESPPHVEYGIEEGEIFGMVKTVEIVGADPAAVKPFTDCVQDNLYDLLFEPPSQEAVRVEWPMAFKR